MRVLFSEMNNAGGGGLWEDDALKFGHVRFNFLRFQPLTFTGDFNSFKNLKALEKIGIHKKWQFSDFHRTV